MRTLHLFFCTIILCLLTTPLFASEAWVWEMLPATPDYDKRWQQMDELWAEHWNGKNLNKIIELAKELAESHPDRPEPDIWLSRTYFAKASYSPIKRFENYATAETYADRALQKDPSNIFAFKNLMAAAAYAGGRDYVTGKYGHWINQLAPLPSGYVLPPFAKRAEWPEFVNLYAARQLDIKNGEKARSLIEKLAEKYPDDYLVQSWACRVNYDLANYHYYRDNPVSTELFERAITYGKAAIELNEHFAPARYWYFICIARSIESKPLAIQAQSVIPITTHSLFCGIENPLYSYLGPGLALSTMITAGGWTTEKGMNLAGVNVQQAINMLEVGELIYPTKFYMYYGQADILIYKKRYAEAQIVLDRVAKLDPDADPYLALENRGVLLKIEKLKKEMEE